MKRLIGLLLLLVGMGGVLGTCLAYAQSDISGEDPPIAAAGAANNRAGKTAGSGTPGAGTPSDRAFDVNPGNKGNTPDPSSR